MISRDQNRYRSAAKKHMFLGNEIDSLGARRINSIRAGLTEGYWAMECDKIQLNYSVISTRLTSKHDGNLS